MAVPADIFQTMAPRPYEALRREIQNGDLLLYSGPEFFSRLIQWATRSPWSHSAFVVRLDAIDRVMVVESVNGAGVHVVSLSSVIDGCGSRQKPYNGRLCIARDNRFASLATPDALHAMSEFAAARLGAPYSRIEILKIALRIIMGWFNRPMSKLLQPDDEYICSEFVAASFAQLSITFDWDRLGFLAPSDIASDPHVTAVGVVQTEAA